MAREQWPLMRARRAIEIVLTTDPGNQAANRLLLADTGAGGLNCGFEFLLREQDCLQCGGVYVQDLVLGGAYSGTYPVYLIPVQIPTLGFSDVLPAVAASAAPVGFDGIACFGFLNRFTYGNFGHSDQFGLEI